MSAATNNVESALCMAAAFFTLAAGIATSKIYCDCGTLVRRLYARVIELATLQVGAGFIMAVVGTGLMFYGAEKQTSDVKGAEEEGEDDTEYKSAVLRRHRTWFTRASLVRSFAAVLLLNALMPVKDTAAEVVGNNASKFEAFWHTFIALAFLVLYLLSHDDSTPPPSSSSP